MCQGVGESFTFFSGCRVAILCGTPNLARVSDESPGPDALGPVPVEDKSGLAPTRAHLDPGPTHRRRQTRNGVQLAPERRLDDLVIFFPHFYLSSQPILVLLWAHSLSVATLVVVRG